MIIFLLSIWIILGIISWVMSARISKGKYLKVGLEDRTMLFFAIILGPIAFVIALSANL